VEQKPVAEKRAAFLEGLIPWKQLSSEEQKACMGPKPMLDLGNVICYEPEGLLKEFWDSYLYPRFLSFLHEQRQFSKRYLRHGSEIGIQLFVIQDEISQELRPTIVVTSATKVVSKRAAYILTKLCLQNEAMPALASSFDVVEQPDLTYYRPSK
jgi:hypothetical protein